jgi:adenylate cyclase
MQDAEQPLIDAMKKVGAGDFEGATIRAADQSGVLAHNFNQMVEGLRERDKIRDTFGRYMTQQVSDAILKGEVKLGGERRHLTILRADLPEFESLAMTMGAEALVALLNRYFAAIVAAVMEHDGVVDKFVGGDLLVIYGAPVKDPKHAEKAVRTALDMRARMTAFNQAEKSISGKTLHACVGIDTGPTVTGNIGCEARMEYTVIGRPVVVAERLAQLAANSDADILLSEETAQEARGTFALKPLPQPVDFGSGYVRRAYSVIGLGGRWRSLPDRVLGFFRLPPRYNRFRA